MDPKEIELQALVTEREGMIAENMQRAYLQQAIAYTADDFYLLAGQMRALV